MVDEVDEVADDEKEFEGAAKKGLSGFWWKRITASGCRTDRGKEGKENGGTGTTCVCVACNSTVLRELEGTDESGRFVTSSAISQGAGRMVVDDVLVSSGEGRGGRVRMDLLSLGMSSSSINRPSWRRRGAVSFHSRKS